MFKRFNWIVVWLVGAVTCTIYTLYAWFTMGKNQNKMAEQVGVATTMNFIVAFLLGCVTLGIVPLVWMYKFCKQQVALAEAKGVELAPTKSPIVLWLLLFVPIYSFYMLCSNYNKLAEAYEA